MNKVDLTQCFVLAVHAVPAILYHSLAIQTLQALRLTHMMNGILKFPILVPCWMRLWPSCRNQWTMITMCPTTQCTTCWCPQNSLESTNESSPFRETVEVCSEPQAERELLLDPDGMPRDQCKEQVYTKYIPTLFLSYDNLIPAILLVVYSDSILGI